MLYISQLIGQIGSVIDRLTLPAKEKRELEAEIKRLALSLEGSAVEGQSSVIREESRGNWLQRSWRPLIMITFATIIVAGTFTDLPLLAESSRFWDLLEIGLGGYVVGRSGEKIVTSLTESMSKRKK